MRFGVARDLVTPDIKTYLGGYGSLIGQYFTDIHDDLYVKTLVLDDGRRRVVLISYDLIFHDFDLTDALGEYIRERHGIEAENLIVSYSHTHTGPALRGFDTDRASPEYEAFLVERTKSCIDRACINVFEGTIEYGTIEGDWNMHRRRPTATTPTNAPHPEGEKDNTLSILRIRDRDGMDKVLLANYSCHPVALGDVTIISSAYPGRLCQLLETEFFGATAIFFQGAGACSRPRIAQAGTTWKRCTFDEVDDMAASMAKAVKRAVRSGTLESIELDLAARAFVVPLEIEPYSKEHLTEMADDPNPGRSTTRERALAVLDRYDTMPDHLDVHASVVRLSDDLYIAFLCGEVTYPIKRIVQEAFGPKNLIFIGYGDSCAYIPSDEYIKEGGYEAEGSVLVFTRKGPFKPGVDAKMVEAFGENLAAINSQ